MANDHGSILRPILFVSFLLACACAALFLCADHERHSFRLPPACSRWRLKAGLSRNNKNSVAQANFKLTRSLAIAKGEPDPDFEESVWEEIESDNRKTL
jgi:hypothetical protein